MNSTERLVEAYYRAKGHFTITDIKVENGNNRQFDILTFDNKSKTHYHVEVSVTHALNWTKPVSWITERMGYKFFGQTTNKRPDNNKTDFAKGKSYLQPIKHTYEKFGIDFNEVVRVWCTWALGKEERSKLEEWREEMSLKYNIDKSKFDILLFRDNVLSDLLRNIETANYDDELLRTLSLVQQHKKQTQGL